MKNTVKWVSGNKVSPRIAVTWGWEGFRDFLANSGFDTRLVPETGWVDSLDTYDVVACFGDRFAVSDTALREPCILWTAGKSAISRCNAGKKVVRGAAAQPA
jgi:hypothetical protein